MRGRQDIGHRANYLVASVLTVAALLSACAAPRPSGLAPLEPPRPEPVVSPGYQKIAPAPLDSPAQMLAQTAAVFRGVLKDVSFGYDDCAGPRTHYVFSDATTLVGVQVQPQVMLKVFGGPTPYGTWAEISEHPQLALDSEYVVFLRNTDWTYSPIVGNWVFRREMLAGREVLIDPTGYAVTGWGEDGPALSAGPVSGAVGQRLRRYPRAELPTQASGPNTDAVDPRLTVTPATSPPAPAAGRTEGAVIAGAPSSLAEIRQLGLFEKPATSDAALANIPPFTAESLATAVRAMAERARISIGGRLALEPYWRCTGATPTVRARR